MVDKMDNVAKVGFLFIVGCFALMLGVQATLLLF